MNNHQTFKNRMRWLWAYLRYRVWCEIDKVLFRLMPDADWHTDILWELMERANSPEDYCGFSLDPPDPGIREAVRFALFALWRGRGAYYEDDGWVYQVDDPAAYERDGYEVMQFSSRRDFDRWLADRWANARY